MGMCTGLVLVAVSYKCKQSCTYFYPLYKVLIMEDALCTWLLEFLHVITQLHLHQNAPVQPICTLLL